ncbi:hypothetical protein K402DRAFT_415930 [Aulographum hederae CBS 113979]|uniref:F-box domain-containing protein n=1 Tax=Aulographum hederae CBS 113979 TaxID=1176131 RepID=A0A6G1HGF2_9PEZI|nr:hypothetical protein K402DRAFT_415930 [Aulographum hederae CBS 113979]
MSKDLPPHDQPMIVAYIKWTEQRLLPSPVVHRKPHRPILKSIIDPTTPVVTIVDPRNRLLSLPAELRNLIYLYSALEPVLVVLSPSILGIDPEPLRPWMYEKALLRTCRQIRAEAWTIFLAHTDFHLMGWLHERLSRIAYAQVKVTSLADLAILRHLKIVVFTQQYGPRVVPPVLTRLSLSPNGKRLCIVMTWAPKVWPARLFARKVTKMRKARGGVLDGEALVLLAKFLWDNDGKVVEERAETIPDVGDLYMLI